ncbi:rhodanese-like domain-containing protein [bacterium (Candidatus Blackallbacteria) CG17_big_fil_post_rev_8_21_14_2_50_48_46]|uniref:Rhodanese-like domain-containing protein n=1 Tax=bacterium (Candidatus Blackallbacteria) CG17_big_fil_post_rev_8_21_14_2_50_48_46 TaxID=2014261 RepID=A0A2M7G198_9BACT|nr:MAG: sulfurtransferase [bacterium (Candidatus Blackallbacteria) CG18_big_fil_WC_8_21_14_2_50_49_26]PIW15452.1 MAG: rhodanese-like domain-containing protein [bacterium (Candidatus Blackallbacteria) CG17_big_fil_post_rev_8_21_14_2_50_48_46]PIW45264.1 MAG: rhodanese-like domain-containing protein [bacterium (Candidatus Blackallbacteria) CG13_big_fil_rev_8_21_14_2_50_49_14]
MLSLSFLGACAPQQKQETPSEQSQTSSGIHQTIPVTQAAQLIQSTPNLYILDVRTADEFKSGHLDKAQQLDYYAPDFESKVKQLDKKKTYLLYCHSGRRSGSTLEIMKTAGFEKVYDLEGGFTQWQGSGQKVVKP